MAPQPLINIMYDELLALFFKYNTFFSLYIRCLFTTEEFLNAFQKFDFLPFKLTWSCLRLHTKAFCSPSISFTGIFQELSSLPTQQPFHRTPLMSLSPLAELITYWFKPLLQKVFLINYFKEIFTKDFRGVTFIGVKNYLNSDSVFFHWSY